MRRIVLVYGGVAGAIGSAIAGISLGEVSRLAALEWLGYLVMIAALSLVFVGVKQYRDQELGGVIRFATGLKVGLGIVVVASVTYVAAWEAYLAATDHAFMDAYAESVLERRAQAGATEVEQAATRSELVAMAARYERTPARRFVTFLEIFPVGLVVALASAAVLKRPEVLPAAGPAPAEAS